MMLKDLFLQLIRRMIGWPCWECGVRIRQDTGVCQTCYYNLEYDSRQYYDHDEWVATECDALKRSKM
jgi:hypothetical protein